MGTEPALPSWGPWGAALALGLACLRGGSVLASEGTAVTEGSDMPALGLSLQTRGVSAFA